MTCYDYGGKPWYVDDSGTLHANLSMYTNEIIGVVIACFSCKWKYSGELTDEPAPIQPMKGEIQYLFNV